MYYLKKKIYIYVYIFFFFFLLIPTCFANTTILKKKDNEDDWLL